MGHYFSSAMMQVVFDAFHESGGVPRALLQELRVSPSVLLDGRAWIDRDACMKLLAVLTERTGDPCTGLHLAAQCEWERLAGWGRQIVSAPTLGAAIRNAARGLDEVEIGTRLELLVDEGRACMRLYYEGLHEVSPDQFLVADVYSISRLLGLGPEPVPFSTRLAVQRPPARCRDQVARMLGPRIVFGASVSEIVFPAAALSMPLEAGAVDHIMHSGQPRPGAAETGREVMRDLCEQLELEPRSLARVAADLGLRQRTVQRHLARWGVTFEEILDDYRKRRAGELLRGARYTVTDVAFRLGYSDSAHFTRAFRRWYGESPSRYLGAVAPCEKPQPLVAAQVP